MHAKENIPNPIHGSGGLRFHFYGIGYFWRLGSGQSITESICLRSLYGAEAKHPCRYNHVSRLHKVLLLYWLL